MPLALYAFNGAQSKNADAFGRRTPFWRRRGFFSCRKSEDLRHSPISGLKTLDILLPGFHFVLFFGSRRILMEIQNLFKEFNYSF